MRFEDYTVERIGDDENRKARPGTELHLLADSRLDASVRINAEADRRGQARYRSRQVFLVCGTGGKKENNFPAPRFQFLRFGGYILQGMIGRLITHAHDSDDEISPARGEQYQGLFAFGSLELGFRIETSYHGTWLPN